MRKFTVKTIFSGDVVGKPLTDKFIAIPEQFKGTDPIQVTHEKTGDQMTVGNWDDAVDFRVQKMKKFPYRNYTVGYFEWRPDGKSW
jgi:hypothetical protein